MKRSSGLLLHITSLPSSYGIGDFGPDAYRFVDTLQKLHIAYWQILPLTPTEGVYGHSPYSSPSAFAGNTWLVSPELLYRHGLLQRNDLSQYTEFSHDSVNYDAVCFSKQKIFQIAFKNFKKQKKFHKDYEQFLSEQKNWLSDYALFVALKNKFGGSAWSQWPNGFKMRQPEELAKARDQLKENMDYVQFLQFIFYQQWQALRQYCHKRKVQIIGDMPIYASFDSADVWAHPEFYKLDENLDPQFVAGVPPDYFSETGQRWGNPVYKWDVLKETRYAWWVDRVRHSLDLYDYVRIDHFRGFAAYWEIPASEPTAIKGYWVQAPGEDFFQTMQQSFVKLPIIAEDLGYITQDVKDLMQQFHLPGMKILLFAFGGDMEENPYIPEKYVEHCIVYTGTHDNNTAVGWFVNDATEDEKNNLSEYLGRPLHRENIHWELIELAMMSNANTAVIPFQDLLGLGAEARMNTPSTTHGNWRWRVKPSDLKLIPFQRWNDLVKLSNRS